MQNSLEHLAIIMDGNRRWARAHGLPSIEGHRVGYDKLKEIGQACIDRGIKIFTVFAFSTENWSRTEKEVNYLFSLLERALTKELEIFNGKGIRLKVIGRVKELPANLQKAIANAEEYTSKNEKGLLQLAINYGGQPEIVDAVKKIFQEQLKPEEITPETISKHLHNPDVPPPDLIIRTSGEQRLSGFLLWQAAYSELYFVKKHWPDFSAEDLDEAIDEYNKRHRRFGGN